MSANVASSDETRISEEVPPSRSDIVEENTTSKMMRMCPKKKFLMDFRSSAEETEATGNGSARSQVDAVSAPSLSLERAETSLSTQMMSGGRQFSTYSGSASSSSYLSATSAAAGGSSPATAETSSASLPTTERMIRKIVEVELSKDDDGGRGRDVVGDRENVDSMLAALCERKNSAPSHSTGSEGMPVNHISTDVGHHRMDDRHEGLDQTYVKRPTYSPGSSGPTGRYVDHSHSPAQHTNITKYEHGGSEPSTSFPPPPSLALLPGRQPPSHQNPSGPDTGAYYQPYPGSKPLDYGSGGPQLHRAQYEAMPTRGKTQPAVPIGYPQSQQPIGPGPPQIRYGVSQSQVGSWHTATQAPALLSLQDAGSQIRNQFTGTAAAAGVKSERDSEQDRYAAAAAMASMSSNYPAGPSSGGYRPEVSAARTVRSIHEDVLQQQRRMISEREQERFEASGRYSSSAHTARIPDQSVPPGGARLPGVNSLVFGERQHLLPQDAGRPVNPGQQPSHESQLYAQQQHQQQLHRAASAYQSQQSQQSQQLYSLPPQPQHGAYRYPVSRQQTDTVRGPPLKAGHMTEAFAYAPRTNISSQPLTIGEGQKRSSSISYHQRRSPHAAAAASAEMRGHYGQRPMEAFGSPPVQHGGGGAGGGRGDLIPVGPADLTPIEPHVQSRPSGLLGSDPRWPPQGLSYSDPMPGMKRMFPFDVHVDSSDIPASKKICLPGIFNEDKYATSAAIRRPPGSSGRGVEDDAALDLTIKQPESASSKYPWLAQESPNPGVDRHSEETRPGLSPRWAGHEGTHSGIDIYRRDAGDVQARERYAREYMIGTDGSAAYIKHSPTMSSGGRDRDPREGQQQRPSPVGGMQQRSVVGGQGKYYPESMPRERAYTIAASSQARGSERSLEYMRPSEYAHRVAESDRKFAVGMHMQTASPSRFIDEDHRHEGAPHPSRLMIDTSGHGGAEQMISRYDTKQGSNTTAPMTTSPNIPHLSPIQPLPPPSQLVHRVSSAPSIDPAVVPPSSSPVTGRVPPAREMLAPHDPADVLCLECRLCQSTYGNLRSFRIHFAKAHGLEPTADNFVVHTISEKKLALAGGVGVRISPPRITVPPARRLSPDEPPALMRESPMIENSRVLSSVRHDVQAVDRPSTKQVAEVYPMLLPRHPVAQTRPPSPPVVEHSRECLKESSGSGGETFKLEEGETGGAQCARCRWMSPAKSSQDLGVYDSHYHGRLLRNTLSSEPHCSTCMEGFRDASDWREHMLNSRMHLSSSMHMMRSCACKVCDVGFTHAEALSKHLHTVHEREDISKVCVEYRCLFCPAAFSDCEVLYRHTDNHEKDYAIRRSGINSRPSTGSLNEVSYIETAVPDTTCLEDMKSAHSENSSSTKSPASNPDEDSNCDKYQSKRRRYDSYMPSTEGVRMGSGSENVRDAQHHHRQDSEQKFSSSSSAISSLLAKNASSGGSLKQGPAGGGSHASSIHDRTSYDQSNPRHLLRDATLRESCGNSLSDVGKDSHLQQRVNNVIEIVVAGGKLPAAADGQPVGATQYSTSEESKSTTAGSQMPSEGPQSEQRKDSMRYIVEELVAAEVKRTSQLNLHPLSVKEGFSSGLSYDLPRHRATSLTLPANPMSATGHRYIAHNMERTRESERLLTRPNGKAMNDSYSSRSSGQGDADANSLWRARVSSDLTGKNPTTAQLLQEARSLNMSATVPACPTSALNQTVASCRGFPPLSTSSRPRSGTSESSTGHPIVRSDGQGTNFSSGGSSAPLLRDIVSLMNQAVEDNIRGYSEISVHSPGSGQPASIPPPSSVSSGRARCVRDVCDEIIAQSFRDDGAKRSPDRAGVSLVGGAYCDWSRRGSLSASSVTSVGGDSPRSTSTTDEEKRSTRGDQPLLRKYSISSQDDNSPRPSVRSSAALTLKDLMDSPAIARNYHFEGLGGASKTNSSGEESITLPTGPRTERRKSEENISLGQFFADSNAASVERRRNQTFSAGNSYKQNYEIILASAAARKQRLARASGAVAGDGPKRENAGIEEEDSCSGGLIAAVENINPAELSSEAAVEKKLSPLPGTLEEQKEEQKTGELSSNRLTDDDDESQSGFDATRKLVIDETVETGHDEESGPVSQDKDNSVA